MCINFGAHMASNMSNPMQAELELKERGNVQSSLDYFLTFDIPKSARILDVGCNYGSLIFYLHQLGYHQVFGIDVNQKAVEKGKLQYPELADRIFHYEGEVIPFESESFDMVLMFDVIEHIPDIHGFLGGQVHQVLKKGGQFVFQTPNKITNIPWEIFQHKSFTRYKSYHCSLQTLGSLGRLLEQSGFSQIIIEKFNILTAYNKERLGNKIGIFAQPLLVTLQQMPLSMATNFWGSCKKS